ncbi:MAG: GAF domain-containing protein, partial [Burkholderiaceae bacterium]
MAAPAFSSVDARARALDIIDAVQHGMAAALDFQGIVDRVGDTLREVLATDDIGIRWIDPQTRTIHFLYEYEHGRRLYVEPVAQIPGGPGETMARTRSAVVLNSPAEKAAAGIRDLPDTAASLSVAFIPILGKNGLLGTIVLENYERENAYGEDAIRLVSTIAASLGLALENVRLLESRQRLLEETEQRNAELSVISSIQQGMAGSLDLRAIIELVGDKLCELFRSDNLSMMWRSNEIGAAHLMYAVQHGKRIAPRSYNPNFDTAFMRALLANQPVLANSRAEMDAWGLFTPEGFEPSLATLTVPIFTVDRLLGGITLDSHDPARKFGPDDQRLLQTVAAAMGVALENVRLFDETRKSLELQTATAEILKVISESPTEVGPVFEAIVTTAVRLLGCDTALALRNAGNHYVRIAGATPHGPYEGGTTGEHPIDPDADFVSRAIVGKRALDLPDWTGLDLPAHERVAHLNAGIHCALYLPLLRNGDCFGVLAFACRKPNAFGPEQRALAESLRDQALIAIQNVHLFNETREALEQQTATAEVLQVIGRSVADTQPVFDRILDSCERLIACTDLSVMTVDEAGLVHLESIRGVSERRVQHPAPRPVGQTVLAQAIAEGRTVHYPDVLYAHGLPEPLRRMAATVANFSCIVAPMMSHGRGIGAIVVVRMFAARQWPDFTAKEIALVQTFADQAVIGIQNARLFNETKEALERQTATAEILKVIARSPDNVQPVFDAIAASSNRLVNGFSTVVLRIVGETLHLVSFTPTDAQGDAVLATSFPRPLAENPFAEAIRAGKTLQVRDTEHDPDLSPVLRANARARGWRSMLMCPLLRDGNAIGMISVTRREPGTFAPNEVALLQTFADQAVIAIENVRLFNETQRLLKETEARNAELAVINSIQQGIAGSLEFAGIVELVGDKLREVLRTDTIGIRWYDAGAGLVHFLYEIEEGQRINRPPRAPLAGGPVDTLIRTRQAVVYRDRAEVLEAGLLQVGPRPIQSAMRVPIVRSGGVVGFIVMEDHERAGAFGEAELRLVSTIASSMGVALENARLFDETQEALEQQTANAGILKVISESPTDVQPVFDAIVRSGVRLFEGASVAVSRPVDGMVHMMAIAGADTEDTRNWTLLFPFPLDREFLHAVALREGRIVDVPDALDTSNLADEYAEGAAHFASSGIRAVTIVPMLRDGAALGAITVVRKQPGALTQKQMALLRSFADQAVIAIENVRLFNETQESLTQQTAIASVLKVISQSTFDLQRVLTTLVENATRLCDASHGFIFRPEGDIFRLAVAQGASPEFEAHIAKIRVRPERGFLIGRVVLERTSIQVPDALSDPDYRQADSQRLGGYRTMLGVPMLSGSAVVGVIVVWRQEVRLFSDKQIELLETFAAQAVIAIENVRLFNETKEALERQTATSEVLRVISGSVTDTQPVFDVIAQRAARLTGADYGMVFTFDGEWIRVASSFGVNAAGVEAARNAFPMRPGDGSITARAVRDGAVRSAPDVLAMSDLEYRTKEVARFTGYRSVLSVPMMREGQTIGAICVMRPEVGDFAE